MSQLQPQRTSLGLGDDGELQQTAPVPEAAPIYCTQCGSANRSANRFCRTCGQSLDEQVLSPDENAYGLPRRKRKLSMAEVMDSVPRRQDSVSAHAANAAIEIFTMMMVGAIILALVIPPVHAPQYIPGILIAWLLVAFVRRRRRYGW